MELENRQITKRLAIHLNLYKQGLLHAPTATSPQEAFQVLKRLGLIQLDTLNVVTRTHNLVFLARMKEYSEEWYWKMYEKKEIIEAYVHALSILPVEEFPYCTPSLRAFQEWVEAENAEKMEFLQLVQDKIHEHAPNAVSSKVLNELQEGVRFVDLEPERPTDWSMTPVRWALHVLGRNGKLMQVRNRKFGKEYHLTQDWLPQELQEREVSRDETYKRFIPLALDAMGVATDADVADYFRLKRARVQEVLQEMLEDGTVVQIDIEGEKETHWMLSADLELLDSEALADEPTHGALLSPFDNLIWTRERLMRLFGVDYRLECYVPEAQRKFGYYALLILIRGKIVGTIDLKTERKARRLVIKRVVLFEEGKDKQARLPEIAPLLVNLMRFVKADHVAAEDESHKEALKLAKLVQPLYERTGEKARGKKKVPNLQV